MWYKYEEMLDRAYEILEKIGVKGMLKERFEIPIPKITYQKNWTLILNSKEISDILNRDMKHIARFLQKELNTPTRVEEGYIIIQKKVPFKIVEEKIKKYVKEFVICPVCGKPDTEITKKGRILYLKCKACGAESPILYKM